MLSTTLRTTSSVARRAMCSAASAITPPEGTQMMNDEAFVEALVAQGVDTVTGVVGSAGMSALDLFPAAGIRFVSVQHEQGGGHMAEGYARATGKVGVTLNQNGPGVLNTVASTAASFSNHVPIVNITPEAGTATKGIGGFQEVDQIPIFKAITKFQADVNNPARMAELTERAFDYARLERGPVQLNIPRDYFFGEAKHRIKGPTPVERAAGGPASLEKAAKLIAGARNPVILAGGGISASGSHDEVVALAEYLNCPVAVTYLHNDAFPASHPLWAGPLGYLGHKTAMHSVHEADVIIALGTRLGPFGLLPQYEFNYVNPNTKIVQVDSDAMKLGLARPVDVPIHGDCNLAATDLLARLQAEGSIASAENKDERLARLSELRANWEAELDDMTFNSPNACPDGRVRPREALRALELAMPENAMVSTDIGNICSVSNGYLRFDKARSFLAAGPYGNCGYALPTAMGAKMGAPDRPAISYAGDGAWGMSCNELMTCIREDLPVTSVVFSNGQWGAEKKNQVLWFNDRYVGTSLASKDGNYMNFAGIAQAMGAEGVQCHTPEEVTAAFNNAIDQQMNHGKTTVIEVLVSKELGDPFRRDAMACPVRTLPKYTKLTVNAESATGQPVDLL